LRSEAFFCLHISLILILLTVINIFYYISGVIVRLVQPMLLAHPIESLTFNSDVAMSHAIIYEPTGKQ
jgi:hypothetical protein